MRVVQIVIGVVIAAGLGTAAVFAYRQYLAPEPTATAVVSADSNASDQPEVVAAEGRSEPVRWATLAYRSGGRVAEVLVAAGDPVEAGQVLMRLADRELIAQRDQALAALAAALAQQTLLPDDAPEAQADLAQAQIAQAQATVELAEAALAEAELRAPFAGTVVVVGADPGEIVGPGQPAIVLADLNTWQVVTVDVREEDAIAFQVGQAVTVTFAALPDEAAIGTVTAIDLSASQFQGDITYNVSVALERAPTGLAWGMTAFLELDPGQPVVVAPPTAVPSRPASATPTRQVRATATERIPSASSTAANTPTPARTPTPAPTATTEIATYIVQRGDNLSAIAQRFGVTVQAIVRVNNLTSTTIVTGQRLNIPRP